jgi:hypothetical protein
MLMGMSGLKRSLPLEGAVVAVVAVVPLEDNPAANEPGTNSGWKSMVDFMERSGAGDEKYSQHVVRGHIFWAKPLCCIAV